jgi:hypothetical protein
VPLLVLQDIPNVFPIIHLARAKSRASSAEPVAASDAGWYGDRLGGLHLAGTKPGAGHRFALAAPETGRVNCPEDRGSGGVIEFGQVYLLFPLCRGNVQS